MKVLVNQFKNIKKSNSGFVAAEFLFTFVLVISCGIIVFALTFSLMTVEVSQYITWSAARAYSAGNLTKAASEVAGQTKFNNLKAAFPLLTDGSSNWFSLTFTEIGVPRTLLTGMDRDNRMGGEARHPWSGVTSQIELKLFKSIKVPFIGPITNDESLFKFSLHGYMFRNPSQEECLQFMKEKYGAIKSLSDFSNLNPSADRYEGFEHEDNGC